MFTWHPGISLTGFIECNAKLQRCGALYQGLIQVLNSLYEVGCMHVGRCMSWYSINSMGCVPRMHGAVVRHDACNQDTHTRGHKHKVQMLLHDCSTK